MEHAHDGLQGGSQTNTQRDESRVHALGIEAVAGADGSQIDGAGNRSGGVSRLLSQVIHQGGDIFATVAAHAVRTVRSTLEGAASGGENGMTARVLHSAQNLPG